MGLLDFSRMDATKKTGGRLSLETIEQAFRLYCEGKTQSEISEECGISVQTVWKLVNRGDMSRSILPFKSRFIEIARAVQAKNDEELANSIHKAQKATVGVIEVIGQRLRERVTAAPILEDPSLYDGDSAYLCAARERAFNPNVKDFTQAVEAAASLEKAVRSGPGSVTVTQNQAQSQTAEVLVRPEEVDFILNHYEELSNSGEQERDKRDELSRRLSLSSEAKAVCDEEIVSSSEDNA